MKERPIIFTGEMVRALLAGAKTQTRRPVKPQPPDWASHADFSENGWGVGKKKPHWLFTDGAAFQHQSLNCPYGIIGDRLWVRETCFDVRPYRSAPIFAAVDADFIYRADYEYREQRGSVIGCHKWTPSIHMPRDAARIMLEIVSVRVELLNYISEGDAQAEGVQQALEPPNLHHFIADGWEWLPYTTEFRGVWEDMYGPESWVKNPWVWVVEFKRVQP